MPISRRWKKLQIEVETLRKQFLPEPFDPIGVYPQQTKVQAQTRAFVVLTHAEVESYVEELAKDITRSCEELWKKTGRIAPPLQYLLISYGQKIPMPDKIAPGVKDVPQRLSDEMVRLLHAFYKKIKDNNGIKEKNVLSLFGPLGISATSFGLTLLPSLDSYGKLRGDHAHHSVNSIVIATPLDPETEYVRAVSLITDLTNLDNWFLGVKLKIR